MQRNDMLLKMFRQALSQYWLSPSRMDQHPNHQFVRSSDNLRHPLVKSAQPLHFLGTTRTTKMV